MSVNVYDPINDELIPVAGATLYADVGVGSIIAFAGKEINLPEGYLAFNGQTVKRNDYPDLWAFAVANEQVGVDKFFSQGDGSTTFTLADLRETSLKGYGETSRAVGAHVKSGGLAVGEFIDDQLQEHRHIITDSAGNTYVSTKTETGNYAGFNYQGGPEDFIYASQIRNARSGTTTEVKAVGVVWAVKAKQTGLPIDLQQQISKQNSYSTSEINTGKKWIDGKPIYRKVIDLGTLYVGTGEVEQAHNITNLDRFTKLYSYAIASNGETLTLPWIDGNTIIRLYATSTKVGIGSVNLSGTWNATVILEYTKTT